jgi:hypothetical protein
MSAAGKVLFDFNMWIMGLVTSIIAVSCAAPTRPIYTESPEYREQRELQAKTEAAWKTYKRSQPPYKLYARYDKYDNATTWTFNVTVYSGLIIEALAVYPGARVSGPPAEMGILCGMPHGGRERENPQLIFFVDGQRVVVGPMRYSPAGGYTMLGVPRTLMQRVAQGTSVEGRCGGYEFTLEVGHLEGLRKFLAGDTGDPRG